MGGRRRQQIAAWGSSLTLGGFIVQRFVALFDIPHAAQVIPSVWPCAL